MAPGPDRHCFWASVSPPVGFTTAPRARGGLGLTRAEHQQETPDCRPRLRFCTHGARGPAAPAVCSFLRGPRALLGPWQTQCPLLHVLCCLSTPGQPRTGPHGLHGPPSAGMQGSWHWGADSHCPKATMTDEPRLTGPDQGFFKQNICAPSQRPGLPTGSSDEASEVAAALARAPLIGAVAKRFQGCHKVPRLEHNCSQPPSNSNFNERIFTPRCIVIASSM